MGKEFGSAERVPPGDVSVSFLWLEARMTSDSIAHVFSLQVVYQPLPTERVAALELNVLRADATDPSKTTRPAACQAKLPMLGFVRQKPGC
jgi:hypothetical protein